MRLHIALIVGLTLVVGLEAKQGFIGFGAGLQFNLGSLGATITNDGLSSTLGSPSRLGAARITGCEKAANPQSCLSEQPGANQKAIIQERLLKDYEANTGGLIESKLAGPMTGWNLDVFYEQQYDWFFWRADFSVTRKLFGGRSTSSIAGFKWYDVTWDYKALIIPVYFGIRAKTSEKTAVYFAGGFNYHDGGWRVGGNNIGDIPSNVVNTNIGAQTVIDNAGKTTGGAIISENARFRTVGWGFNWLAGIEGKLDSGNVVFMEAATIVAGSVKSTETQAANSRTHLAGIISKPVILAGTTFRFGYKMSLGK